MSQLELDAHVVELIRNRVANGEYPDASAVVREGLRLILKRIEPSDGGRVIQEASPSYDQEAARLIAVNLDQDVVERIRTLVDEQPEFADASAVVSRALYLLEDRAKFFHLRKLIAEAEAQIERGEFIRWRPGMMQELLELGRQRARDGLGPNPDVL